MVLKAVGENFYHTIIYLIFNVLGARMDVEVAFRERLLSIRTSVCSGASYARMPAQSEPIHHRFLAFQSKEMGRQAANSLVGTPFFLKVVEFYSHRSDKSLARWQTKWE